MNITIEDIAHVAHDANRAFCLTLGDSSQPFWYAAPEWQRDSAINGVKFHLTNPNSSPSASHENWLAQKEAEGWKYGPVKDADKKEHPCFLPYEDLPIEQQMKDYLFVNIVHTLKSMVK